MAEDQVATRKEGLRDTFLWTRIFSTFRVALDPKLLLAAAGIVVTAVAWWFWSVVFYNSRSEPKQEDFPAAESTAEAKDKAAKEFEAAKGRYRLLENTAGPEGRLRTWPWTEKRGPNPFFLVQSALISRVEGQKTVPSYSASDIYPMFQFLIEPLVKFLEPVIYLFHPEAGFWNRVYFLLIIFSTLATWAFFGGAITRMAVVQFARGEKIGMTESLRFTCSRYISFLFAPLFPLILLAFLTFLLIVYWFFGALTVFFGDIVIAGLFWPLVILFGLIMALTLVGLVGWPLMYSTISAEGSDSFDALSRSYSYVYQAPWHYIWYTLVALAYGAVVVFFVGFMGSLVVYLGKWGTSQAPLAAYLDRDPSYLFVWAPTSFDWQKLLLGGKEPSEYLATFHFWNYIGAGLVAFWIGLIFLLVIGFGYSYFWSASSIIYLLMRRKVDETDLDEVHLEEDELEEPYVPPAPPAGAAKPPAPAGNLIPPESLTLRTPSTPATEPLPGTTKEVAGEPAKVETSQVVAPPAPPPETSGTGPAPGGDGNQPV